VINSLQKSAKLQKKL